MDPPISQKELFLVVLLKALTPGSPVPHTGLVSSPA